MTPAGGAERTPPPVVAVCIASYRRPRGLEALLASLAALDVPPESAARVDVVVVDNDREGSARPVVERACAAWGLPVTYLVEPERNIALARNRGVREALRRGAEYVAFVDDDEVVHPDWLARLLDGRRRYGADVVGGAVLPVFPPGTPAWVRQGGFHEKPRHPTGTMVRYLQTSNALVSGTLLGDRPEPFDPAFGVSGGEDSVFFARCLRGGARFVFVDEAVVEERIPASRTRPGWLLQRAFRVGNAALHGERSHPPADRRVMDRLARGTARMLLGIATIVPLTLISGRAGLFRALSNVAYGGGCLAAALGYRYLEYWTIHGE